MQSPHRIRIAGFSLSELLLCSSVLGAMATVARPTAWTYLPAAAASGGAREIRDKRKERMGHIGNPDLELDWKPAVTLAQPVEDTIAYYRGHEDTRGASIPPPGTTRRSR